MADGADETSETITLKVRDQTGEEMFFKVKKAAKLQKLMDVYAQRRGISSQGLRFTLDGDRIGPEDTPKMLELEDNDQIDCMLEATGGMI
mmetsp:Transcript_4599/g.7032  ORF Transcript_4599/g.7032 Transcript_4599/m.7032 type:complete len:90 (-) Transcript_4599:221-490(-)|eukprot:CAMPEP_0185019584 /NCGR_PEP_ID=MMETSP1103-20130426/2208_1 /TAXON_ID=36769 /ORGANISM="Paraphysomonas bandaiensis, Strain Caron Lab Isolate" /LENGTH=89 /DNA_ID=CAMNT_0027549987 /DNA_START=63 /DNA_END=332 /DNA_ORIENTATION=-